MVSCGESFTVFVTSKHEIFTCGTNVFGNGENREYQSVEKPGFEKEEISHIACGAQHIVIAANEKLYSVGRNIYGQLGTGNLKSSTKFVPMSASLQAKTVKIACGDYFTMVLTGDGQLYSVGANKYGQLGLGHKTDTEVLQLVPFKLRIKDVACGHGFVLIVDEHGYVHACGRNHRGQLGIGHAQDQIKFVHVEVSAKISRVFCGREQFHFLI
jgi:alpha-tubulin suppressor-like RCC1 family protein